MKKVFAFKSASGLVSEDEDNNTCWSGMTKSDVVDFVIDNKDKLKKILA